MTKGLEELKDMLGVLNALSGCKLNMCSERIKPIVKELKAFEIIKKKKVDVVGIVIYEDYEQYCRAEKDSKLRKDWLLTQDEYNLLKEVLKDV